MDRARSALICALAAAAFQGCGARSELDDDAAAPVLDGGVVMCDPLAPFQGATLVAGDVNTNADESDFRLSPDELTAFFTRTDATGSVIYQSHRTALGAPFGPSTIVASIAGSGDAGVLRSVGSPNVTTDLLTLIYEAGHICQPYASGDLGQTLCAVERSAPSSAFGVPHPIGVNLHVATPTYLGAPYVLASGLRLYADGGGLPGYGIATASRATTNDDFGALAAVLIDFGIDGGTPRASLPVVTRDELTIYFTRADLSPGYGSIWRGTRTSVNDGFSNVHRVAELATTRGEQASWISSDRCRLYFSRMGSQADIFVASR